MCNRCQKIHLLIITWNWPQKNCLILQTVSHHVSWNWKVMWLLQCLARYPLKRTEPENLKACFPWLNSGSGKWNVLGLKCLSNWNLCRLLSVSYVPDRVQNILFFNSYPILLFYTFSTMCILEDRSLWILDWGAIVSNVVSMILSGRTYLINAFSLYNTHTDAHWWQLVFRGCYVLYFTTLLVFAQFKVLTVWLVRAVQ